MTRHVCPSSLPHVGTEETGPTSPAQPPHQALDQMVNVLGCLELKYNKVYEIFKTSQSGAGRSQNFIGWPGSGGAVNSCYMGLLKLQIWTLTICTSSERSDFDISEGYLDD